MWVRGIAGLVLCAIGLLWILQGVGVLNGSFMTGQSQYTALGAVTAVLGMALLVWAARVRHRALRSTN
jgi:Na+/melibiose symporter-like transporter